MRATWNFIKSRPRKIYYWYCIHIRGEKHVKGVPIRVVVTQYNQHYGSGVYAAAEEQLYKSPLDRWIEENRQEVVDDK